MRDQAEVPGLALAITLAGSSATTSQATDESLMRVFGLSSVLTGTPCFFFYILCPKCHASAGSRIDSESANSGGWGRQQYTYGTQSTRLRPAFFVSSPCVGPAPPRNSSNQLLVFNRISFNRVQRAKSPLKIDSLALGRGTTISGAASASLS